MNTDRETLEEQQETLDILGACLVEQEWRDSILSDPDWRAWLNKEKHD